ncbi:energy transducer TonB [uncultured Flavobacterium sp.]|uniref:energy transducer TonB n=1 Tax=uncultured Flavobacterium sp. TaxID=165435 RepID=UPI0025F4CC72|nr:energy transducer TonB [uncultured Flavobacterium sp.]
MSKVSIFDHGWIDLVFEGRNHEYGAYQLRKQDSRTTLLALFSGIALMGALVAIPAITSRLSPADVVDEVPVLPPTDHIVPVDLKPELVLDLPKADPPAATAKPSGPPPASFTPTQQLNQLTATSDPVDDPIPATPQLTNPGAATSAGSTSGTLTGPTSMTQGTGSNEGTTEGNGIESSLTVDKMPAFPGGMEAFYEQVGRKYRVPELEVSRTFKVYVSFIVETDGSMTNIQVGRDPGYGLASEAIRVLKSIKTKWAPGQKKGKAVRTAYNLPITVNVK